MKALLKYIIVALLFVAWLFFFDDYKLSKQFELNNKLDSLQINLQETNAKIAEWKSKNEKIENDIEIIEAIGRDNYYMKRDNEDVYIFLTEDEDGTLVSLE